MQAITNLSSVPAPQPWHVEALLQRSSSDSLSSGGPSQRLRRRRTREALALIGADMRTPEAGAILLPDPSDQARLLNNWFIDADTSTPTFTRPNIVMGAVSLLCDLSSTADDRSDSVRELLTSRSNASAYAVPLHDEGTAAYTSGGGGQLVPDMPPAPGRRTRLLTTFYNLSAWRWFRGRLVDEGAMLAITHLMQPRCRSLISSPAHKFLTPTLNNMLDGSMR